ncbi:hypothetical protein DIPPA_03866 [Diplonema papillatum]|nr:hypothetical protein DIPPA_03866 [Diplonema papillatum]
MCFSSGLTTSVHVSPYTSVTVTSEEAYEFASCESPVLIRRMTGGRSGLKNRGSSPADAVAEETTLVPTMACHCTNPADPSTARLVMIQSDEELNERDRTSSA